jgi:long-chain acyl-CoA synthetase
VLFGNFYLVISPVDLQANDEVLKHIIKDSKCKRVFTDEKGADRLASRKMQVIRLDEKEDSNSWLQLSVPNGKSAGDFNPDDQVALFYTSGTTGLPKGVPLTHANLFFQLDAVVKIKLVQLPK